MFCTVMLRCESRAGLGEPVEPVVKMTSAPSSSVTRFGQGAPSPRPSRGSYPPRRARRLGNRRKGSRAGNRVLRVHRDAMLEPRGTAPARRATVGEDRRALSLPGRQSRAAGGFQRSNHLGGGQAQIQRGDDHADLEAAILQQNVIHGQRQQGDQEIALGKAQAQQLPRQRRGDAVELAPGDVRPLSALRMAGASGRAFAHFATTPCRRWRSAKVSFVIVEGKLRHAHRFTHSCSEPVEHSRRQASSPRKVRRSFPTARRGTRALCRFPRRS
jgi:hypothetical protein